MKNIIIHPTDFSKCSMVAFEYSIHLAKVFDCELLLVHTIDSIQLDELDQSGHSILSKSKKIEKEADHKLQELGHLVIQKNLRCRAELYSGGLTSWLPDIIKNENPFLTVMGTTGAGSIANKVFGSNTNSIIHSSSSPVLVIPSQSSFITPKSIVLAADLGGINEEVFRFLNRFVKLLDSSLQLLYVITEDKLDQAHAVLEKVNFVFGQFQEPINPDIKLIVNRDYINGISEHIQNDKPSMFSIVMSDKNFIEKFLFGSLSEKMIHHSNVPLLVLPQNLKS